MKKAIFLLASCVLMAVLMTAPAFGGVVFEVETTDHTGSDPQASLAKVWADGDLLKASIASSGQTEDGEMIYRGEKREMIVVNHGEQTYFVIDDAMIQAIGGQLSQAMQQMQEALKDVPPEQRAMVEQMMKKNMPQMDEPAKSKTEMKKTSDRAKKNGYACTRYEVFENGKKVRDVWVTDWDNVEGGSEVAASFKGLSEFIQGLLDSLSSLGGMAGGMASQFNVDSFAFMKDLDGFPVVTQEFGADGSIQSESVLRSAERRTFDPADFEPPKGYRLQQMFN